MIAAATSRPESASAIARRFCFTPNSLRTRIARKLSPISQRPRQSYRLTGRESLQQEVPAIREKSNRISAIPNFSLVSAPHLMRHILAPRNMTIVISHEATKLPHVSKQKRWHECQQRQKPRHYLFPSHARHLPVNKRRPQGRLRSIAYLIKGNRPKCTFPGPFQQMFMSVGPIAVNEQ